MLFAIPKAPGIRHGPHTKDVPSTGAKAGNAEGSGILKPLVQRRYKSRPAQIRYEVYRPETETEMRALKATVERRVIRLSRIDIMAVQAIDHRGIEVLELTFLFLVLDLFPLYLFFSIVEL